MGLDKNCSDENLKNSLEFVLLHNFIYFIHVLFKFYWCFLFLMYFMRFHIGIYQCTAFEKQETLQISKYKKVNSK